MPAVRDLLVCPACHGDLAWLGSEAACSDCGARYPVEDGIPQLIGEAARADAHKMAQAAEHDARPDPSEPPLLGLLIAERLRRSVAGIEDRVRGGTVVVACGGNGRDAEYLARAGARGVVMTDISPASARRARDRVARAGLPVLSVVADAERLPLRDSAVAVGYVIDGLHHLRDPDAGARELARVARSAVAISEPVAAGLTRLAVAAGAASDVEQAGNRVARIDPAHVRALLAGCGFPRVACDRYAMHYDPDGGRLATLLSGPRTRRAALRTASVLAAASGGWGNKVAIRARARP
jgi:uncharacterized protein